MLPDICSPATMPVCLHCMHIQMLITAFYSKSINSISSVLLKHLLSSYAYTHTKKKHTSDEWHNSFIHNGCSNIPEEETNLQGSGEGKRDPGQLIVALTCVVRVSRAAKAALSAGRASERSASHSSLMACAARACSLATASSAFTICSNNAFPIPLKLLCERKMCERKITFKKGPRQTQFKNKSSAPFFLLCLKVVLLHPFAL